ncbi:hypothetical protein [Tissierella sp.]|nr:hypothetical protein [Tissierella sp.]
MNLKFLDSAYSKKDRKLVLLEFNNIRNICKSKNIVFAYGKGK